MPQEKKITLFYFVKGLGALWLRSVQFARTAALGLPFASVLPYLE